MKSLQCFTGSKLLRRPISLDMRIDHWMLNELVITGELDKSSFSEMMRLKD